jgi:hypothetical protein
LIKVVKKSNEIHYPRDDGWFVADDRSIPVTSTNNAGISCVYDG